jgi:biotin transport system substrate-specific component
MAVTTTSTAPLPRLLAGRTVVLRAAAVAALAAVMAVASQLAIPIEPVPLTLQTFALFVIAGLCGMRMSFEVVVVWLILAIAGVPVLSGLTGGPEAFTGPSGGYLIGMLVAAPVAGGFAERVGLKLLPAAFLLGHAIVLAFGWAWLAGQVGAAGAWSGGVSPFVLGAVMKSFAAALVVWPFTLKRVRS